MPIKDPEKAREYARRYRKKNLEARREYSRRYREENREKNREKNRLYRENNLEACRENARRYREENREKSRELSRIQYGRVKDLSLSLGITIKSAAVFIAIEALKKEIDRMSPRQDAPPSKLAGANRTNLGKGLHPGGKPSASARAREVQQLVVSEEFGVADDTLGESAPSARILARGVSNHGDMQAFLEALALDVVHGRVDHKTANFLLQTIRTRLGIWVQAQTFGAKLDIAPYREVDVLPAATS